MGKEGHKEACEGRGKNHEEEDWKAVIAERGAASTNGTRARNLRASGFRHSRAVPAAGPFGDERRAVGPAWATLANLGQDALRVFGQQNKKHDDWTAKKKKNTQAIYLVFLIWIFRRSLVYQFFSKPI